MLLVIHAGPHKSASTYLQHVLCLNRELLAEQGVYFQPDTGMTANHATAWMALLDNFRHVEAHIWQARRLEQDRAILSSEDFETLIFEAHRSRQIEAAAAWAGVTEIEWHFCLRDPGDYFASMYAELSKASLSDYFSLAMGALRDGRMHVAREANLLPVHWDFCLDYETHLTRFARAVSGKVVVHDFRDQTPFPGHGVIDRLIGPAVLQLPSDAARNRRLPPAEVEANLVAMFEAVAKDAGLAAPLTERLGTHLSVPEDIQLACREAISRKYAPGMERLLAHGVQVAVRPTPARVSEPVQAPLLQAAE